MATNTAKEQAAARRLGFQTLDEELAEVSLAVTGRLPEWLSGTLVRVTPAMLDIGGRSLRHWFDGLAMLNAFTIARGGEGVSYANRYLDTSVRRRALEGRADFNGFGQDPCRSLFQRVATMVSGGGGPANDNANVNLTRLGERYVAMTELPLPVEFDPETLATHGTLAWSDSLPGQISTAHPHHDAERGELYNYVAHLGPSSSYRLFSVTDGTTERREIARLPVRKPSYMHSFGLSEHYLVLVEFPLVVEPARLALSGRAFIDNYRWEPQRGTRITAVERGGGAVRASWEAEPFFSFHHVNAFERAGELVVDLCRYDDASVIWELTVERLRSEERSAPLGAELCRYRLPLAGGEPQSERLCEPELELPRINYRRANARAYRHAYGAGARSRDSDWIDQLVKVDVDSGETHTWHQPGCYPGEPVFVAAPDARAEDEGAILSVVLDGHSGRSFLLVLDAASFAEHARAEAPHAIPLGFHGQFAHHSVDD